MRGTYQKHSSRYLDLAFWTIDRDNIGRRLLVWEAHPGIGLGLDIVNEDTLLAQESAMISPRDGKGLVHEVFILRTPYC